MIDLEKRWKLLSSAYCTDASERDRIYSLLVGAYKAPGRFYHTPDHVRSLLEIVDDLGARPADRDALEFAVWFHDVVYDTHRRDNEARSAEVAREALRRLGVPAGTIEAVCALVLATAGHDTDAVGDASLFIDADLAILGAAPKTYRAYSAAVRREYAWVPIDEYRAARADVLDRFLKRDRIYQNSPFIEMFEERARGNLRTERADLARALRH